MKAIIFGAGGQDGHYLSTFLIQKGYEVVGVSRREGFSKEDLTNFNEVEALIKLHKPAFVFHLAANSTTAHKVLFENHATIVTGSLNILEAVRMCSPETKVFISGSGLQFKNVGGLIKETDSFEASSAYAASRIQSVYLARYFRTIGIKVYVGYFFNHDSPLRTERHMTQKIAKAAKRVGEGSNEKILIGDLDAIKEYSFAGDIVKGIWTLTMQEEVFEANIASGKGYSIKEWLDECFSIIGKNWKDYVEQDKDFISAYTSLVGDPTRISSLGWKPEVDFKKLAKLMME